MPDGERDLSISVELQVDDLCVRFEKAVRGGESPTIEDYLIEVAAVGREKLFRELVLVSLESNSTIATGPGREDLLRRFPQYRDALDQILSRAHGVSETQAAPGSAAPASGVLWPERLERCGKYVLEGEIARGGMGVVYRGRDESLDRAVAVKVMRRDARTAHSPDPFAEARIAAELDHPHIVPVYDVGRTEDGWNYVVAKLIEGRDLAALIEEGLPEFAASARIVSRVADALHHAHLHGVVHRDMKPANIIIHDGLHPFVTDFGVALREEDFGTGARFAGTYYYMSPEQARGEGHRVDGRADVYSLGVVLYELLTGRRPFSAPTPRGLLDQIKNVEVRPPRQKNDAIPRELERICLKAMAKRVTDRYTTALDMAEDLRHFLGGRDDPGAAAPSTRSEAGDGSLRNSYRLESSSASGPSRIVPKGLRSFEARDADFFLELVPGPRDRDGLPEVIRHWKSLLESRDPDPSRAVGVLYGPSGCGKSSLVKAGLLPRLAGGLVAVYFEATAHGTEERLLIELRRRLPLLPTDLSLVESLGMIRREPSIVGHGKVLIAIDQFEQWLHAHPAPEKEELILALRQVDGGILQVVVIVRDDFWLSLSRFMNTLEAPLVEGRNSLLVDLFDVRHARKVLVAFGRAFDALPDDVSQLTQKEMEFVDRAVEGLAVGHKVVCVKLALFAEMMKSHPWVPATLKRVGGTAGVGVAFLEETFGSPSAPPEYRLHRDVVVGVLKALLPDHRSDFKGHMKSWQSLLTAAGEGTDVRRFEQALRILDGDLRLITPADSGGADADEDRGRRYYQLAHDYLVPSVRDWLTRHERATRRGRARLALAERATLWLARPDPRVLPSTTEWLRLRTLTAAKSWTETERDVMSRAGRRSALFLIALVVFGGIVSTGWSEWLRRTEESRLEGEAAELVRQLGVAESSRVPSIVKEMGSYREQVDPLLRAVLDDPASSPQSRLGARLALLPTEPRQVEPLLDRLLEMDDTEAAAIIRQALRPHAAMIVERLWAVAENTDADRERRFQAATCLATFATARQDAQPSNWTRLAPFVAADLVDRLTRLVFDPRRESLLIESFMPVAAHLTAPLSRLFAASRGEKHQDERLSAAKLLSTYGGDDVRLLIGLALDSERPMFEIFFRALERDPEASSSELVREREALLRDPGDGERRAERLATATIAMLRLGCLDPEALTADPAPGVRARIVTRAASWGVEPQLLIASLSATGDVAARRALLLCLGEAELEGLASHDRDELVEVASRLLETDPDAGVHGASEWLLGRLAERERARVAARVAARAPTAGHGWQVSRGGMTWTVIPGPVEFAMGSREDEPGRQFDERRHVRRIERDYAIATKEVTVSQFRAFLPDYDHPELDFRAPDPECPALAVPWRLAAAYCNSLSRDTGLSEDQWCYVRRAGADDAYDVEPAADALERRGYRLPTEAEWEYAARAGSEGVRHFGDADALLSGYAWCNLNADELSHPVGRLKPNDLGLFDMLGNVMEWCHDVYAPYPGSAAVGTADTELENVLRGGCYYNQPRLLRSSDRVSQPPAYRSESIGFRVARTVVGGE